MAYVLLAAAIALELMATTLLKYSRGFTQLIPSAACMLLYFICFFCLSWCLQHINLSVAYATWCAVGIVATTLISIFLFREQISPLGVLGIVLVVAGVILLNLFGVGGH